MNTPVTPPPPPPQRPSGPPKRRPSPASRSRRKRRTSNFSAISPHFGASAMPRTSRRTPGSTSLTKPGRSSGNNTTPRRSPEPRHAATPNRPHHESAHLPHLRSSPVWMQFSRRLGAEKLRRTTILEAHPRPQGVSERPRSARSAVSGIQNERRQRLKAFQQP